MRVTFVSPPAYATLARPDLHHAGGAEFQQIMLARWLRDHGHEVSFVVADYGQPEVEIHEGFTLYRSFALGRGNRKLRFVPDMLKLRAAIHRSRPDLVNQRSTSFYTGQCCRFSHECGAAFSFSLGIDYNVHRDLQGRAPWFIQRLYRWGVEHAELVLAQTVEQAREMSKNFRCSPRVLPNVLEIPAIADTPTDGDYVLWVGSLARRKRPERFLELAESLPEIPFVLVGGPGEDPGYDVEMKEWARRITNLRWRGFVPPSEMEPVYAHARLLVGTSRLEGFPNTYLQAWSNRVPVISVSVDPDGVIARDGLGEVTGEDGDLRKAVETWWDDAARRREAGSRARRYVERRHDVRRVGPLALEMFEEAVRRHGR